MRDLPCPTQHGIRGYSRTRSRYNKDRLMCSPAAASRYASGKQVFTRGGVCLFCILSARNEATATVVARQLDDCEVRSLAVLTS